MHEAPRREACEALGLLKNWLEANERSQAWLSRTLGVKPPSVSAWMEGTSRPLTHLREAIESLTGIPVAAWEMASEREQRDAALERIRQIQDAAAVPDPQGSSV